MHMMYCFVNNVHVDYADLVWEGLHYSLEHPSTLIFYPIFTKIIIPPRRLIRLTPPTPNLTTAKADDIILQDTIQLILAEQKGHDELEAKKNVQKVKEHLINEEIEKLLEGTENVENVDVDSSTLRQNDNQNDPDTRFMPRQKFNVLDQYPQEIMEESLPKMLQHDDLPIWLALKIKFERLRASNNPCRTFAIRPRDQDDPHDDAHPEGENSVKRQKTSEHGTYVVEESSSGQVNENDDELPTKKVSQELIKEMLQAVDEVKLRKVVDEMLRQRKKVLPYPQNLTSVVQIYQRHPKAPALSLVNQDLLYLKKGNSGPEKIVLSLHKFPAVIFPADDIEERTFKWVDKCVKKFNPYARYSVEHYTMINYKSFGGNYNSGMYSSGNKVHSFVLLGDRKTIPITNTGHSILPILSRPLHLHNVLATPNIIKNLIYVLQFTRDNKCTIEFDEFSFSVKDLLTRHILLRCDSSGDLYPVTKISYVLSALLSISSATWHQCVGHPDADVLQSIISHNFISYNKEKSSHNFMLANLANM
uniref:Ribonuclease H-like domain-containing protein n=1 Tax=Tanacetum cinerariifolium TaxID=118510 RepID=A0A6L2M7J9_TANCI|nr:ribonuclease H-like domain-containing protein [Tanacetum cinerariifolium]